MFAKAANVVLKRLGYKLEKQSQPQWDTRCVTKSPKGEVRGRVLLAYVLDPFLPENAAPDSSHTHHGESLLLAQAWLDRGYTVDAIDYLNRAFVPQHNYDYFISARVFFKQIASRLNEDCKKIVHLDTSHYAANNRDTYQRVTHLQERRGVSLIESVRIIEESNATEAADYATVLGNYTTSDTYAFTGTPLHNMCVPAVASCPRPENKDMEACRNSFIWLGSNGLLHKGLDIVLEAFAQMPELSLTVCGPIDREPSFAEHYAHELSLPNVTLFGWIDVASDDFRALAEKSLGLIYPSCREGQAGAVVNCASVGLIPIISKESGVDTLEFGETLANCKVETVCQQLRKLSAEPAERLLERTCDTWDYAQNNFTSEAYRRRYDEILDELLL